MKKCETPFESMNVFNNTLLLRLPVAIILLMHSVPGMFNNGINEFGNLYLNEVGFTPFGVPLAWAIKVSHVLCALCLLLERYTRLAAIVTIFILLAGIVMVHFREGWFVVGGGRNGLEFNFLLIFVLLAILFPRGIVSNKG